MGNIIISEDQQLSKELHKPVTKKFQGPKVYLSYRDKSWSADLAGTQLLAKYNKGVRLLLCIINIYCKYT